VSAMARHLWRAGRQPAQRQLESTAQARGHRV
jgi:hypothetical protein